MKLYIKGIKFFSFILIIIIGTCIFIRKSSVLTKNVTKAVKNSLTTQSNYIAVGNSSPKHLSRSDLKKLVNIGLNPNMKDILVLNHRCRINDTLFNIIVWINQDSVVQAVSKPTKFIPQTINVQ